MEIYFKNNLLKKGQSTIGFRGLLHPLSLRRSTSDIPTFNQVFLNQEYAHPVAIKPQFIIDCGANIGLASVFFAARYPNALIASIEPEKSNFEMLKKNTVCYSKIDCVNTAIWSKNAILRVERGVDSGNWGFACKEVPAEDEHTFRAISVKEVMDRYDFRQIDILKIDIEGSELELFSCGYEEWLPLTKVIMIELHDSFRKGCSKSFFRALVQYDFSVYPRGEKLVCIRN